MGSAAAAAAYYAGCELYENYQTHFLDSCYLCNRPLTQNHDIFMYRGNTPFCSQECRQEQMEMDEATEKRLKLSSSKKSKSVMMMMRQLNSESAAKESSDIMTNNKAAAVRTGGTTVAVA